MNIRIQAKDFTLTPAIEAETREHIGRALERFAPYVLAVDVFLGDENGPKGGRDKRCTIRVSLPNRTTVPIESRRSDLYVAIANSARRARRVVRRVLARQRRFERRALRAMRYGDAAP